MTFKMYAVIFSITVIVCLSFGYSFAVWTVMIFYVNKTIII